jgi:hypothetical protein
VLIRMVWRSFALDALMCLITSRGQLLERESALITSQNTARQEHLVPAGRMRPMVQKNRYVEVQHGDCYQRYQIGD